MRTPSPSSREGRSTGSCRCCYLSPFRWADFPAESQFMADPAFYRGAATGQTMNSIQTQAIARFEEKNGYSAGTLYGISAKADKQAASLTPRRKRSTSHNGGGGLC